MRGRILRALASPRWLLGGCCCILLACAADASSAEAVQVEVTLIAEVRETVTLPNGEQVQRFAPAGALAQGQTVYYTVRIRNPTPVIARNVEVVRRVPANTVYEADSASGPGADIEFSADGAQTFARAGRLNVIDASGSSRRATPEDYTHIRWRLRNPLAPGAVALARFRAVFR